MIRFSVGDSYCLTFPEAPQVIAAAERLSLNWDAVIREGQFGCPVNIAVHRGRMFAYRSFLYGEGMMVAAHVQRASEECLADGEGGIFLTGAVRDDLQRVPGKADFSPSPSSGGMRAFPDWRSIALAECDRYSAASLSTARSLIDTRQWMRSSCGG